jgi:hypothetical protein
MDLRTGKHELIIPISKAVGIPNEYSEMKGAKHWFNHLLVACDGKRFIFLHRWQRPGEHSFLTRMLPSNPDGTGPYVVDPYGYTSHFIWRDSQHILARARHPSHGNKFYPWIPPFWLGCVPTSQPGHGCFAMKNFFCQTAAQLGTGGSTGKR